MLGFRGFLAVGLWLALAGSPSLCWSEAKVLATAGSWEISYVGHEDGTSSCLAMTIYGGDTKVLFRKYSDLDAFTFELYNSNWRSIRNKKAYSISAVFYPGDSTPYVTDDGYGVNENNLQGVFFEVGDEFVADFREKAAVQFFVNESVELGHFRLTDSSKATRAVFDCIAKYQKPKQADPFDDLEDRPGVGTSGGESRDADVKVSDPFIEL